MGRSTLAKLLAGVVTAGDKATGLGLGREHLVVVVLTDSVVMLAASTLLEELILLLNEPDAFFGLMRLHFLNSGAVPNDSVQTVIL